MYGMPQPNTYGQYGFGGYAGTPGAAPGMPQSAGGAGGLGNGAQQGAGDPNAAGGQGQGQWPSDPSSYYSNYWGGKWRTCWLPSVFLTLPTGYYGQQPTGQGAEMNQN
jgi:nucleolysin TIA-1/TIAR